MNMNNQNLMNNHMNNMNNMNMNNNINQIQNNNNMNYNNMNMNNMNMHNFNNCNVGSMGMNNMNYISTDNMKNMINFNNVNNKMISNNIQNINNNVNIDNRNNNGLQFAVNNPNMNNELQIKLKNIQKENEQLKKNLKNSENENKQLSSKLDNLNSEINSYKMKSQEFLKKQNELQAKLNNALNIINNNKKSFLGLENENKKLNNQLIQVSKYDKDLKNLNANLNNQLKKEKDLNANLNKHIEELKKEKNKEFENYRKNDYNEEFIGKKLENFYDIIINIKSIRALSDKDEGWPIKWNQNYNNIKEFLNLNQRLLKIGILGNGNMGKSFLLSKIFKENIPSGFSVITEGISIKINKEKNYALFDSAGLQTPLIQNKKIFNKSLDNEKEYNEYVSLYKDKTQTENFIQNLILHLSDMILIVVGKITFNEQRLINKIKNELSILKERKSIYVIHNLMNFLTKKQVEEHIKDTLLKSASFYLEEVKDIKNAGRFFYVEKRNENNKDFDIYHLIMAREATEAGDYYNNYLYHFLRERFNDFPHRNPLNILDEIKNKFAEWSIDLLEHKIEEENIIIENDGKKETKFIYKENDNEENNRRDSLIPKACINDELGFVIYRSSEYEPFYTCYTDNDYLVIKLEALGNVKINDVYAELNLNQIFVKGIKERDRDIYVGKNINDGNSSNYNSLAPKEIKLVKETRKFGKFNLIIPYGNEIKLAGEIPVENKNEEGESLEEGIKIFKFPLAKRRKK